MPTSLSPSEALQRVLDGNTQARAAGASGAQVAAHLTPERLTELASGQSPYAAVLTCSDSRVAPELALGTGLGEIFPIRNAGQIADEIAIGSIEYAVAELQVPLVLVLRHTGCGAVRAAVAGGELSSPHIAAIVDAIAPAVVAAGANADAEAVGKAHLDATLRTILDRSELIAQAIADGRLTLAGGTYALASGTVTIDAVIGAH